MRATKKTNKKNHSWKNVFFYLQKLNVIFRKSATIQCARWTEINACFFGNARPKSNARAPLKQRKNIVAICAMSSSSFLNLVKTKEVFDRLCVSVLSLVGSKLSRSRLSQTLVLI